ncbi:hypothetical protein Tdes44962_MAKER06642 [Teratosphaeria destructans]|uniref:Uncharacterized protein n=1 Tax=Teratosphaeria destructans TaxID=418781 RepID=A0A9W7W7G0_9PEZI|nr:hypothetical protein Tdes44962_MAKER06642 [Teratosphaeria destructans]
MNPVTYTVSITAQAHRWGREIDKNLVASHRTFDPSLNPSLIRVITHNHQHGGGPLFLNGLMQGTVSRRFIRVVIEVMKGSLSNERKSDLLKSAAAACLEYEGKYAQACEVEVVVRELEAGDVLLTGGLVGRRW